MYPNEFKMLYKHRCFKYMNRQTVLVREVKYVLYDYFKEFVYIGTIAISSILLTISS